MTDPPIPETELSAIVEGTSWDLDDAIEQYIVNYESLQERTGNRLSEERIAKFAWMQVGSQLPQFQREKKKRSKKEYKQWLRDKKSKRRSKMENMYPNVNRWQVKCYEHSQFRPSAVECTFTEEVDNPAVKIECPECGSLLWTEPHPSEEIPHTSPSDILK